LKPIRPPGFIGFFGAKRIGVERGEEDRHLVLNSSFSVRFFWAKRMEWKEVKRIDIWFQTGLFLSGV
jgi:hypothetical protein